MGAALLLAAGCGGSTSSAPRAQASGSAAGVTTPRGEPPAVRHDSLTDDPARHGWVGHHARVVTSPTPPTRFVQLRAANGPADLVWGADRIAQGRRYWSFRGRFRVESRAAGQSVGLATVKNAVGAHHADLFIDAATGGCRIDLFSEDSAGSPNRCDDGAWHTVELQGDYGSTTYTMEWRIDGEPQPSIRSTAQPPTTVRSLWLGDSTPAKTNVTDWADVAVAVAGSPLGFLAPG